MLVKARQVNQLVAAYEGVFSAHNDELKLLSLRGHLRFTPALLAS
jgi:hypothetical protein